MKLRKMRQRRSAESSPAGRRHPRRASGRADLPPEGAVAPLKPQAEQLQPDTAKLSDDTVGASTDPSVVSADRPGASAASGVRRRTLIAEARALRQVLDALTKRIDNLATDLEKAELKEYVNLMRHPWSLIWRNFISGLLRGIGIAFGFTFFAATIVWLLQQLGALNLPIVGDYVADIVRIVQRQLEMKTY
ncbi:DUF5665 domain-containing protein [Cohnella lubricantis]|nr:DUF5665 domain-containing protein [Cohnella lubricantis]MBP2116889.1 hypothetical protein [Cohnella lubricantis]